MKIAALIRAHHKISLLQRLVSVLTAWDWNVYVHVNKDNDIQPFYDALGAKLFIKERVAVQWGSYTQMVATLNLLEQAVRDEENTHFYILSGQCYPLKTGRHIAERIAGCENGGNFITIVDMPVWHKPLERLSQWYINKGNLSFAPNGIGRFSRRLLPRRNVAKLMHGVKPYGGSAWWILSRNVVEAMLEFMKQNPWYLEAYKFSYLADEIFFQTLFVHLGFKADGPCPTSTEWVQGSPNPKLVTRDVYEHLASDWHFMGRKFDEFYPDPSTLIEAPSH